MYVETKILPIKVRELLKRLEYGRTDIDIQVTETISPLACGGDGRKYYFAMLNLETGESKVEWGSWGGANIFNTTNPVDLDRNSYKIPASGLVIQGCIGYIRMATIYVSPENIILALPKPDILTKEEKAALYCYSAFKGGKYRQEELARHSITPNIIERLVTTGYLKRSKNGATQITTKGKNSR